MLSNLPPLHPALAQAAAAAFGTTALPANASPSLVWERYPRMYGEDRRPVRAIDGKDFLSSFVKGYAAAGPHLLPGLQATLARYAALAGPPRTLTTTSPFATGLGADHPVENGFSFDRLTGVPFLSGSGLKGLARAGAALAGAPAETVLALLGSPAPRHGQSGEATTPGTVCFLGAWPTSWPRLMVEILNPHHPDYMADQGKEPSKRSHLADYTDEPVPVCYLAMAAPTRLSLFVRPTGRASGAIEPVFDWLRLGFDWLGAGAKTAAGLGRMTLG